MDAIRELAEFVCQTSCEDIPEDVREHDKLLIMDTLGVILAGSAAPGVGALKEWALEMGGAPVSTIFVTGEKTHPMYAGMVNATMSQALDFDDTNDAAFLHTHCSCLTSGLAIAESMGGVSGKDLLTAVILGSEIMGRLGRSCRDVARFTRTGTLAYFGATATVGKLLGLDPDQLVNAFGIAYAQTSTTLQSNIDGALVKRVHPAFGVRGAFTACMLTAKGFSGPQNVVEGKYGYMSLYENGQYDREAITGALGQEWDVLNIGIKPFPCARDSAGALECGIAMHRRGISPDRVRSIHITMPEITWAVAGKPYEQITGNKVVESILSSAWCAATGLCHGNGALDNFSSEGVTDAAVADIARKVTMSADLSAPPMDMTPVCMTVTLDDGTIITHTCEHLTGTPGHMPDMPALLQKFQDCAEHSLRPFSMERRQSIIDAALNLDQFANTNELIDLMKADLKIDVMADAV